MGGISLFFAAMSSSIVPLSLHDAKHALTNKNFFIQLAEY